MEGGKNSKVAGVIQLGKWGKQSGGPQNEWSFELKNDDKLVKITIDHGELIYSLMFTSESGGVLHTSDKVGGWSGGETVSDVNFDGDEEIIGINGTIGNKGGNLVISSLSFQTNKRSHGPFGSETKTVFSVPWDKGSLVGFYGLAGSYIDAIGVYLKDYEEIINAPDEEEEKNSKVAGVIQIGKWGKQSGSPQNEWSFELQKDQKLAKITIDHGELIYSLMFSSGSGGVLHTSDKIGGWNGGETVSEVNFDADEEIIAINGTIGNKSGNPVISSLSFQTNKRAHGPFGSATEIVFSVPWDKGSLVGFYGLAGSYIDAIGVYLKASEEIINAPDEEGKTNSKVAGVIKVGKWGKQSGGPQNEWSFELENDQKIVKITIDHGELVYSLMFTRKYGGALHTSKQFGGWTGGENVSEVIFDGDEEITGINGTIGNKSGNLVISSLSFETNKKTHGPFGSATETVFTVAWDKGSLIGFYGLAGLYIDAIGIYLKASEETVSAPNEEVENNDKVAGVIHVGKWGKQSGGSQNEWSFELEKDHKLAKITIDHGELIYSLMFSSGSGGVLHTSNKFGGWNGGETVSEVNFDADEEIIGINGTIGNKGGNPVISSLSFQTNKRAHGPFGRATEIVFSVPWDKGSLVGFYGLAGSYIDAIGVYLKASKEIINAPDEEGEKNSKVAGVIQVGKWGKQSGGPQNEWSFELENAHRMVKITIDHGELIYSLMFTSESGGVLHTSKKVGGWNGGETISEVIFDDDEEIIGINGTIGKKGGNLVISSMSFETNKKTHGPFGSATETVFTVAWDKGSLVGFYGLAGYYIDAIGIYLKASEETVNSPDEEKEKNDKVAGVIHVGKWGKQNGGSQNEWSFELEKGHRMAKITIDHGELIYSLMFSSGSGGVLHTSDKFGGWNGGENVSEVNFDGDEEIIRINGTIGNKGGNPVISSLSFHTNKRAHGPFGNETENVFSVPWNKGSLVGFYGLAGSYIDAIGVYLKDSEEIINVPEEEGDKNMKVAGVIQVGKWGKQSGGPQNEWSFELEKDHKLAKITIDYGELIYSLMFTSEIGGVLHPSDKAGGWNGGETISEVNFDGDEEIIAINGTIGNKGGNPVISSLSFQTNKRAHGPFGSATQIGFSVPWDKGSLVGFYGLAGSYIDAIGVYLKASEEIVNASNEEGEKNENVEGVIHVGKWGKQSGGSQNEWSFELLKDHKLAKITIDHGEVIYSLMFSSGSGGVLHTSDKVGGWNGGENVSEVNFDGDEEITGINGTIGNKGGNSVISSLSFQTNKRVHGPFGSATETGFSLPWEKGSLVGFYGLAGYYIDAIGVYLNASEEIINPPDEEGNKNDKVAGVIHVGKWGKQSGSSQNEWSFELEKDHKLVKITIDHGELIYSLIFSSGFGGVLHTSNKVGGWNGGETISEVNFDGDEEIIGINGTIGIKDGNPVISSLSFQTNKRIHGPFGSATETVFSIPWDKGSLVGFYGLAGSYIDAIGVYLEASEEIINSPNEEVEENNKITGVIQVGKWGKQSGGPQNEWSFKLENDHKMVKITIDHGELIYSLLFTSEFGSVLHTSDKVGGWNGGETVSEVIFDGDEEIIDINGTIGNKGGNLVISSLSFETNKKTHGPFGSVTETVFTVAWDKGSLVGFYGLAGYYIDAIGVYLKYSEEIINDSDEEIINAPNEEGENSSKEAGVIQVGKWGKQSGGPQNEWSFEIEKDHKLVKITIDHGDVIYSLKFTSEFGGDFHTSEKVGGLNGGETVSEVDFDRDEEIIGINGTIGNKDGDIVISSLSFQTNKSAHGPFGSATDTVFSLPWDNGSLVGFYGLAGYYIDAIGVNLKPFEEIVKIGTWGKTQPGGPQNVWSFQLEINHHLKKITIDHGDVIYSLMFTSEYEGVLYTSNKIGGWNGGETIYEVNFDGDEEIIGVNGTIGNKNGNIVISSLSFQTNKSTHGPFGSATETVFSLPWENGSLVGFYGLAGSYIDSIGVYLKASEEIKDSKEGTINGNQAIGCLFFGLNLWPRLLYRLTWRLFEGFTIN